MLTKKKLVLKHDLLAGRAQTCVSNVIINCERERGKPGETATVDHAERSTAEKGNLQFQHAKLVHFVRSYFW